ncbi:MAG: glycosyltransferase [Fibromonadaceae bacterium]|jgi:glycosyltransferase involved in cell wall biosynthesis|nr:glycosyltransferase [Fibromonadaceae bacterium]
MCHKLTIAIPVYNEAENIRFTVEKIEKEVIIPHIINIVYDTETDNTLPIVYELQKTYKNITLVKNLYGSGALGAMKTGLETAQTEYVVITMADLSDEPQTINEMVKIAEEQNASIVCGSRYMKGGKQIGGPFLKGLMSRFAGLSLHFFAGVSCHDVTNGFKLWRTSFLKKQKIESMGGFEFSLELVVKAHLQGEKICETPTIWTDRVAGKSNFKFRAWLPNYLKWYFTAFKCKIFSIF